jgi:hypothetical protein
VFCEAAGRSAHPGNVSPTAVICGGTGWYPLASFEYEAQRAIFAAYRWHKTDGLRWRPSDRAGVAMCGIQVGKGWGRDGISFCSIGSENPNRTPDAFFWDS